MGDNTRTAIVISIILLILFLLLLGLFKFLGAEESDEGTSNVTPAWTLGPPPRDPGSASDEPPADYETPPRGSLFDALIQTLIEQAVESQQETQNQMEAEKAKTEAEAKLEADKKSTQAETQNETTIQTQLAETQLKTEAALNSEVAGKAGEASIQADAKVQTELQNQTQIEVEFNFEIARLFGEADGQIDSEVQNELQNQTQLEAEFNFGIARLFGEADGQIDSEVQNELQNQTQLEAEFNTKVAGGVGEAGVQVDSAVQIQLETAIKQAESELNTKVAGGVGEAGVQVDSTVQIQLETAIKQAESELNTKVAGGVGEAGVQVDSAVQIQLETAIKQAESELNTKVAGGVGEADGQVDSTAQIQLETAIKQAESELNTKVAGGVGEAGVQVDSAVQIQLETAIKQAESELNTKVAGGVGEAGVQVDSAVQIQLETAIKQAESELNTKVAGGVGEAGVQVDSTVQIQLETAIKQAESELNTKVAGGVGEAGVQVDSAVQIQLETAIKQAESELNTKVAGGAGEAGVQVDSAVQIQLETAIKQAESELNTKVAGGVGEAGVQVDSAVQIQLETAIKQAESELNTKVAGGVGEAGVQVDSAVQSQLQTNQANTEAAFNSATASGVLKVRLKIDHTVLTATRIARMMEGEPVFDQNNQITTERRVWKRTFNKKLAAAVSYSPRSVSARSIEWKKVVAKYYTGALKKVQNSIAYRTATAIPRTIDVIAKTKIGGSLLSLVDAVDTVADVISILTTFVDGLLYDPDGEGLDWMPLSKGTFEKQAQKMIDSQIEEITDYNNQLPSDELKSAYPLIAGPLDVIDIDPADDAYRYSHGDTEYNQRRVELEVEAVMDKILKSNAFRSKTIQYCFDGDEELYTEYVESGESIAEFANYLPEVDYDEMYNQSFSNVCAYHGGVVYEDTYNGSSRRRFQCGWKDYNACERAAVRWSVTSGQVGSYAEWFTFDELVDTKGVNPINTSRMTLLKSRGKTSACIVTGSGQRSLCESSKGTYKFQTHSCEMTPETCQSLGTCYDPAPVGQSGARCYIPKGIDKAQMFFGQSFPREWIRIYGCRTNGADTMEDIGDFLTGGGNKFISDIMANQRNWNKGMKAVFSDPSTIINFALIFGALIAAAAKISTGPIMFVVMIVIGSQMADQAVRLNQKMAQMPSPEPAEFTVGGWKTTSEPVEQKINSASTISGGNLQIISKTAHNLETGNKVSIYRLYYNSGDSVIKQAPIKDATVVSIQSSTTFTVSHNATMFLDFNYTWNPTFVKTEQPTYELRTDGRKVPVGIGYVTGWLTKPLRPKNHSGGIVPVSGTVEDIAGVLSVDFYTDVKPDPDNKAYDHGKGCSPTASAFAWENLDGRCVNRRIRDNFLWQSGTNMTLAVNNATGTIGGQKGFFAINSDNWMDKDEYKRLCSKLDTGGLEPMIHGWSIARDNKLWCLPARPPESWADPNIGTLNYSETTYAKNRSWTDGFDPQVPQFSYNVMSRGGNEGLENTAGYWYYQLVYDPETFNRSLLWNDSVLAEHFLPSTITEMRQYYCNEDFLKYSEDPTSVTLDPKCWGYLSISTSLYNFMPMTILGNITQYIT